MSFNELSATDICNLALARIGANRINDIDTDANVQAIQCRLHYAPTRDEMLRLYWWPFAADRAELSQSVTSPDFEYDYAYGLPSDFMCLRSIWDVVYLGGNLPYNCAIEGEYILSDETSLYIRYTKKITDTTKFDPLFVNFLKTKLALQMLYPLAKNAAVGAADRLQMEVKDLEKKAKVMSLREQNLIRPKRTWLEARCTAIDPSHM